MISTGDNNYLVFLLVFSSSNTNLVLVQIQGSQKPVKLFFHPLERSTQESNLSRRGKERSRPSIRIFQNCHHSEYIEQIENERYAYLKCWTRGTEYITSRKWGWNSWNRSRCHSIDIGPTKLYYLMARHSISWQCSVIMTSGNSLTHLIVWIHSCAHCSRHAIYVKVLLVSIWVVNSLHKNTSPMSKNSNISTRNN